MPAERHVQEDPDRQSRRDRLPRHQDAPGGWASRTVAVYSDADTRRAARRPGRRGGALSGRRRRASPTWRSTRSSPPARPPAPRRCIPATASCPRTPNFASAVEAAGIAFIGPPADGDRGDGRQDRIEEAGAGRGVSAPCRATSDVIANADGRRAHRRRDRLSGDDQGLGRRRRQGHAHRAGTTKRGARGLRSRRAEARASFGDDRVFIEKFIERAAPHRDPGAGRRARQRRLPAASASARSSAATRR